MTTEALMLLLERDAKITENALRTWYEGDEGLLSKAEQYSLFAGGKRIRPALVLEFCKLFGGREENALPFACALEMVHTYSLIHDDLPCMDDDEYRRGKLTNHKVFGEANALLAGDSLLTGAFGMLTESPLPAETVVQAVRLLSSFAGRDGMAGGQILDLEGEKTTYTLDELLNLHSLKTGALINCACVLGAMSAGIPLTDDRMEKVMEYSENIGLVFQIVDDVLDAVGDAKKLGKNTNMDASHHKNTFLNFYTVEEAKGYARVLTQKAEASLSGFVEKEALVALADWLCEREK